MKLPRQICRSKNQTIQEQIEANNKKLQKLDAKLIISLKTSLKKRLVVPAEWLEKYAIMRARVTNPVVPVV